MEDNFGKIRELIGKFKDKSWYTRKKSAEEVIVFGTEAFNPLMEAARSDNNDLRFWSYYCLAKIDVEHGITYLLQQFQSNERSNKYYAALVLGESNDKRVVPALIAALNDDSWALCAAASKSLIHRGENVIPDLMEPLKTANYNVAFWITKVFSKLGIKGINVLVQFLRLKNKNVRVLVTEALAESKDLAVVPHLIECLKDETYSVQNHAAEALSSLGEGVVEPLISLIKDEPEMHNWMIKIFDRLGNKRIRPLIELLKHPDRDVRIRAAELLGSTSSELAVKPLIDTLSDKVWLVRKSAANGLSEIGDIAIDYLIRSLKTEDENVRYWITTILGKIGDKTIDPLVKILQTGTRDMKTLAAQALGETRDPRAVRPLIESLKDESWVVRNAAATSLKQLSNFAVLPLIKVLMSQNEDLRFWSQKIIQDIGNAEVEQFIDVLQNSDESEMRYFAAYGLSIIKSKKAIEPLISSLLNDNDDWVKKYSATALGAIGDKRVIKPLISMLDSYNEELSLWIAKVLGRIGNDVIDNLMQILTSQDEKLKFYAMIALAETGDLKSVEALIKLLGGSDSMADHAVRALSTAGEMAIKPLIELFKTDNFNAKTNAVKILSKFGEYYDKLNETLEKTEDKDIKHWLGKVMHDMKKPKLRIKK
ncbi:MAG: HEAT repeat domain-containing protein [Candidatus Wallbacteria bacterium]